MDSDVPLPTVLFFCVFFFPLVWKMLFFHKKVHVAM